MLVNFGREFREFHSIAGEERLPIFPGSARACDPGFEMIFFFQTAFEDNPALVGRKAACRDR